MFCCDYICWPINHWCWYVAHKICRLSLQKYTVSTNACDNICISKQNLTVMIMKRNVFKCNRYDSLRFDEIYYSQLTTYSVPKIMVYGLLGVQAVSKPMLTDENLWSTIPCNLNPNIKRFLHDLFISHSGNTCLANDVSNLQSYNFNYVKNLQRACHNGICGMYRL